MVGIQQTEELLKAIELVLVTGKKVMADGKVNLADLPAAMLMLNKMNEIVAGIEGLDQVPGEIKDLSLEEVQMIITKFYAMLAAVKAA